ncbi:sensor histidine kinase [Mucisphaera sp.]|uniref:sensor histidine kinase n=1 Tax=Mucisphaera sp. TaxID=2913024 RepID=UPI003D0D1418
MVAQGFLLPAALTVLLIAVIAADRNRAYLREIETERRMRRLDRVEALGTMAAGIGHDFGNLVLAIRAYHSSLRKLVPGGDERIQKALTGLGDATTSTQTLIESLMTFARQDPVEAEAVSEVVDLGEVVREGCEVMEPLLGKRCTLRLQLSEEALEVRAGRDDLLRVLNNLLINARDALSDDGAIEVSAYRVCGEVWLMVRDEGVGMPGATQRRVFDPFFTTRQRGKGTGLGLSVVFGLVQEMDGRVEVSSTEGVGTSMVVVLPWAGVDADTESGR